MALHHLHQIIGKPHSIFIPKTCLAKSIFCCSKYHSIFSTQSHQPEVIFKSCCKINQRQNPIISSITEMFPFWGQKLPSYPVFLICVTSSSPVTLIPPGGGLQNPPAGFVKTFLPSSVLFFSGAQSMLLQHYQATAVGENRAHRGTSRELLCGCAHQQKQIFCVLPN